jgi:effector-binding domain-containing protein
MSIHGKATTMLETPQIQHTAAQLTAIIRLTIPRSEIQTVMGPAIGEVLGAIEAQGLKPAGPVFSHHLKMDPEVFDFEVGVPISSPVSATGRVQPGQLRAAKVVKAVYQGPYEGLEGAWDELCGWIASQQLAPAPDLWEFYVIAPDSSPNPRDWRTELNQPLLD